MIIGNPLGDRILWYTAGGNAVDTRVARVAGATLGDLAHQSAPVREPHRVICPKGGFCTVMPYQYYCPCPQQQLLQGDENYAGQQVRCPMCQQIFVQPQPAGQQAAQPQGQPGMPGFSGQQGGQPFPGQQPQGSPAYANAGGFDPFAASGGAQGPAFGGEAQAPIFGGHGADPFGGGGGGEGAFGDPEQELTVHVICTHCKQVMPTPQSMLGQDAMCPYCNEVITLHEEDTVEFQRQRDEYLRQKEERLGRQAMNWAIGAAVVVGLLLITLLVIALSG